jgi:hypothetical protein
MFSFLSLRFNIPGYVGIIVGPISFVASSGRLWIDACMTIENIIGKSALYVKGIWAGQAGQTDHWGSDFSKINNQ